MSDDEHPQRRTEAEQNEPILALGMIGISNQKGVIIRENGRGLFKRDAMLPAVGGVLSLVPFKPQFSHACEYNYIVLTKSSLGCTSSCTKAKPGSSRTSKRSTPPTRLN